MEEMGETFELKGADRVKARRARDGGGVVLIRVLLTPPTPTPGRIYSQIRI